MEVTKLRKKRFAQKSWKKSYIVKDTEIRTKADNEVGKTSPKKISNNFCGKRIEDVRKREMVKTVTD